VLRVQPADGSGVAGDVLFAGDAYVKKHFASSETSLRQKLHLFVKFRPWQSEVAAQ
jgi:hypothetical protein